jgi:hypothetical protein
MKKKIFISVGLFLLMVVGVLAYLNNRNRTLSPPGEVSTELGELVVSVDYSRPSVRGRLIFGEEDEGALQPYGEYWRLGANEATQIKFSKNVTLGEEVVEAGTYAIYAIPGKESFNIFLNSDNNNWGYSEPDHTTDVVSIYVPHERTLKSTEQFTIQLNPVSESKIEMICLFSNTKFTIPIEPI